MNRDEDHWRYLVHGPGTEMPEGRHHQQVLHDQPDMGVHVSSECESSPGLELSENRDLHIAGDSVQSETVQVK